MFVGMCVWVKHQPRPEASITMLELKLQAVVSCLPWIRGTKFWTSKRVECARSHWAIFLDPQSVVSVTQITSSCCSIRKELQQLVHESRNSSRSSSVNFWFAPRSSECDTISVWIKFLIFNSLVKPGWEGTVLTGSSVLPIGYMRECRKLWMGAA